MKVLPMGKSVSRLDGVLKVTGGAPFAVEHPIPGVAHATVVYSTIAKGRIQTLDTEEAEKYPGVLKVITYKNSLHLKKSPAFSPSRPDAGSSGTLAIPLSSDEVFWNGYPLAVVVAETLDQAEAAGQLVRVTYQEQLGALTMEGERENAFTPKDVNGEEPEVKKGDPLNALPECAVIVGATYRTPPYNHNPIEPHATTAHWEGDSLTVYDATQHIAGVKTTIATMFNIKADNVRVLSPFVGGGFGSKGAMWPQVPLCVMAAKMTGRPVRLSLSREGMFRTVGGRTPTEQQVTLGSDESGKIGALFHSGMTATSTTNMFAEQFTFPARHLYESPNIHLAQKVVQLDTVPNTFMRAPGESVGTFALESAMDELAYATGVDPVQLRILNDPERDPTKDIPFSARHLKEVLQLGAEKFGWDARSMAPRSMRDGDTLIGWGVATAFYPVYQMASQAKVTLHSDGRVSCQCASHEIGTGTKTTQTINLSERLGVPMEKVNFEIGDSNFPQGGIAGGSSTTVSVIAAVENACETLVDELLKLVKRDKQSPLRGSKADDIVARDNGLWLVKEPTQGETYAAILGRHGQSQLEATGKAQPGLEMMRYSMHSYGAQFCEVRVNEDSGEVRVSRWVAAFDCGRILNPKTARSQFRGGIIMGIGMALMEETQRDARTARIMNPSLAEYHVPVNADVPDIEAYFLDIPDPQTPMGAHGVGEIGITGAAAAIANAVFHATGKRVRDLPITLDKLLS